MREDIGSMYDLRFNINYYGADYPVDSLVRKMDLEEIYIPNFQRQYVWNAKEASLFIESILLGLPIPTIFLAKDKYSNKLLIIDGQQRLKTLYYFTRGFFPGGKKFKLQGVIPEFNGLSFHDLNPKDQYNLMDFTIHATVIAESGDSNRMYYLFERLNTTGTPLTPQEIRNAVYHGQFNDIIHQLSETELWKELFNKKDLRLKGQELILRFFALHFEFEQYQGNMKDFLNFFMLKNRTLDIYSANQLEQIFKRTIQFIHETIGSDAFKFNKVFNTAFFETIMLIVSWDINKLNHNKFADCHKFLKENHEFRDYLKSRTTSKESMYRRLDYAKSVLRDR